jgi:hypothetical protein
MNHTTSNSNNDSNIMSNRASLVLLTKGTNMVNLKQKAYANRNNLGNDFMDQSKHFEKMARTRNEESNIGMPELSDVLSSMCRRHLLKRSESTVSYPRGRPSKNADPKMKEEEEDPITINQE